MVPDCCCFFKNPLETVDLDRNLSYLDCIKFKGPAK